MVAPWRESLAEVERSIADCLASLDRYESAFGRALAQGRPPGPPDSSPLWDARLAAANGVVDEVERLLDEQEVVWRRWQETLAAWHGLLK